MYSYNNKSKSRQNISVKENYLFGPQFGLQASATPVNERPPKQGSREGINIKNSEQLSSAHILKQQSASNVDAPLTTFVPERSGSSNSSRRGGASSTRGSGATSNNNNKKTVLPSTAFAHDLASPDPLGIDGDRSSRQSSARTQNMPVYLPGDRVIFAESPNAPGVPIVYRTPEERSASPDRLNLDRRRLTVCPILEGEEQLRLLNYQHNLITRIDHLALLKRLIFLDLYDNQITAISGLDALRSLRVLMLGKNRISRIENLNNLTKLDVLDLHGNQIRLIENLQHLTELRVLNLAGNNLDHVRHLGGMDALTELNLRRNRIKTVIEIDKMNNLQRLFLSFNDISSFEDIQCLGESHSLSELSLDGNPFSQEHNYKQTVLRYMQQLRQLDMKTISEDERRIASVMARKEEEKRKESNKINMMKEKRKMAITNARRQWETMQGSMMGRTNRLTKHSMPELYANHVANVPNDDVDVDEDVEEDSSRSSSRLSRPTSAKSSQSADREWPGTSNGRPPSASHSTRSNSTATPEKDTKPVISGPVGNPTTLNTDSLSELEGDTLSVYGPGALDAFDKNWGIQASGAVTTINFKFIDFDEISKILHKIRVRFPNVHTLQFSSTNIRSLHQLNALSAVRRLDNLILDKEGNPVVAFTLWRTFVLFRLAHFALKRINDVEVSASDIVNAEKFFGTLAHMTTSQLPQSRLLSLLGDKKKQLLSDDKKKVGEPKFTDRTTESVGRAGLVYTPPDFVQQKAQDHTRRKQFVKGYVADLSRDSTLADQKQSLVQTTWPQILSELVHGCVVDMSDTNSYMKRCMEELEKS